MKQKINRLLPTSYELIGLLVLSALVSVIGNSKQLLDYYGLNASNQFLKDGAGHAITKGLSHLDAIKFTNELVTFLIWAGIGLLCFGIAQSIATSLGNFKRQKAVSTNQYIHPTAYTNKDFWNQVIKSLVLLVIGLVVLGLVLYLLFSYVLPIGLTYTQYFLQGVSIYHVGYFVLGVAVIFVGMVLLDLSLRLLFLRQRLLTN